MSEQDLDDPDIGLLLQEMGGKAVPQGVNTNALGNAGARRYQANEPMKLARTHVLPAVAGKQPGLAGSHPSLLARHAPPVAQQLKNETFGQISRYVVAPTFVVLGAALIILLYAPNQLRPNINLNFISQDDHTSEVVTLGFIIWYLCGLPAFFKYYIWTGKFNFSMLMERSPTFITISLFGFVISVIVSVALGNPYILFISMILFSITLFNILVSSVGPLANVVQRYLESRMAREYPVASLALSLFDAIWLLERDGRWRYPRDRSAIATALDRGASTIRGRLFRDFKNTEYTIRLIQNQTASNMAESLREKQLWLATPKKDTRQVLLSHLSSMLIALLQGDWDEFDKVKQFEYPKAKRLTIMIDITRILTISVLPLVIVYGGLHFLNLEIELPLRGYVQGAALIWAMLTLITAIDPSIKDKVSEMKDLFSLGTRSEKK